MWFLNCSCYTGSCRSQWAGRGDYSSWRWHGNDPSIRGNLYPVFKCEQDHMMNISQLIFVHVNTIFFNNIYLHRHTIHYITSKLLQNYLAYIQKKDKKTKKGIATNSRLNYPLFSCMHGFLLKLLYWGCFNVLVLNNFLFVYLFLVHLSISVFEV